MAGQLIGPITVTLRSLNSGADLRQEHVQSTGTLGATLRHRRRSRPDLNRPGRLLLFVAAGTAYSVIAYTRALSLSRRVLSLAKPYLLPRMLIKPRTECALCRCRYKKHSVHGFIPGRLGKTMGLAANASVVSASTASPKHRARKLRRQHQMAASLFMHL